MEVSVAVYLVEGGLFCQAENSSDLSWKKGKDLWLVLFGLWFHTSGDFGVIQGKQDIFFRISLHTTTRSHVVISCLSCETELL